MAFVISSGVHRKCSILELRAGWPFRSLFIASAVETENTLDGATYTRETVWDLHENSGFFGTLAKGIATPKMIMDRRPGAVFDHLPIAPIVTGFTANTLLYSLLFVCPWAYWKSSRLSRRRSRGQCLTCGYNLTGLTTCPECGNSK